METVFRKKEEMDKFTKQGSILFENSFLEINIQGLNVERSYEDRDVFIEIRNEKLDNYTTWMKGEDAIELGQMLIKHGTFALQSNMINHQKIHSYNTLKKYMDDNIVKYINLTMVDDKPVNYGTGFCEFEIKPDFYEGKEPIYQKNFKFNDVIYFGTYFKDDFIKSLKDFGGNEKVIFHNYENKFIDEVENNKRKREKKLKRIA